MFNRCKIIAGLNVQNGDKSAFRSQARYSFVRDRITILETESSDLAASIGQALQRCVRDRIAEREVQTVEIRESSS